VQIKPIIAEFTTEHFEHILGPKVEAGSIGGTIPNDPNQLLRNQRYKNLLTYTQAMRQNLFFKLLHPSVNKSRKVLQLIKEELGEIE
jgi:hypothetical protein